MEAARTQEPEEPEPVVTDTEDDPTFRYQELDSVAFGQPHNGYLTFGRPQHHAPLIRDDGRRSAYDMFEGAATFVSVAPADSNNAYRMRYAGGRVKVGFEIRCVDGSQSQCAWIDLSTWDMSRATGFPAHGAPWRQGVEGNFQPGHPCQIQICHRPGPLNLPPSVSFMGKTGSTSGPLPLMTTEVWSTVSSIEKSLQATQAHPSKTLHVFVSLEDSSARVSLVNRFLCTKPVKSAAKKRVMPAGSNCA